MSAWTRLDTASCVACSCGSRTESRPSGLSSRITSPVSVIHDVVEMPANDSSARNAGVGRPPVITTSRRPMCTATGALVSVAGSNTMKRWVAPSVRPALARRRPRLSIRAGGSASVRTSVRVPAPLRISSVSLRPSSRPDMVSGPVPGSSEKSKERSVKAWSTLAVVLRMAGVVAPSSDICSRPSSCSSKPSSVGTTWPTVKPIFSPR